MRHLLYIGIFLFVFLSTSVADKIGIKQVGTVSSSILLLLSIWTIIKNNIIKLIYKFKEEFFILFIALIIIFFKYISGSSKDVQSTFFFLIVPMLISVFLRIQNLKTKKNISKIIVFFFIIECLLAIYERILQIHIFPEITSDFFEYEYKVEKDWQFRSISLLGNPLTNAICVSIIMGYISITSLKPKYKVILIALGFISLFCFNARGAILAWIFLIIFHLFSFIQTNKKNKIKSFFTLVAFIIFVGVFYYLVENYEFGGRLAHNSNLVDKSFMARIEVFNVFSFINDTDFWWGNTSNYTPIMEKLDAAGVENSYIVIIINYGIVFSIILFIAFFYWIKNLLKFYSPFNKAVIIISFIFVGSMNNVLAIPIAWNFFILCASSFSIVNKKIIKTQKISHLH